MISTAGLQYLRRTWSTVIPTIKDGMEHCLPVAETGLPGRPRISFLAPPGSVQVANVVGLPGFMFTRAKCISAPNSDTSTCLSEETNLQKLLTATNSGQLRYLFSNVSMDARPPKEKLMEYRFLFAAYYLGPGGLRGESNAYHFLTKKSKKNYKIDVNGLNICFTLSCLYMPVEFG